MTLQIYHLTKGWLFHREDAPDSAQDIYLPHSPFVADLDGQGHWTGRCTYRRSLQVEPCSEPRRYVLAFGAAMHTARISLDGTLVGVHEGGYLPFEVDVSDWLGDGRTHELEVELDNGDAPDVPPGKPSEDLDFCYYGGLYRPVELRSYPLLHISDAISADEVAGGGLFVRTESLSDDKATLALSVHVANAAKTEKRFGLRYSIFDDKGIELACGNAEPQSVAAGQSVSSRFSAEIKQPRLWSIDAPYLHRFRAQVVDENGVVVDERETRFGIRWFEVSRSKGLVLNGKRIRPRGANRHQDYPRVGYAISDAAQYRDAKRLKESGFDYVRLSHYPQSPAFLDACDELGILVMNCIPGWQYLGSDAFKEACYRNARELIRRDRNHPCVVFWELSLNETDMDDAFMQRLQGIGHEEFPGGQMFVCGWIDQFDVFIHSRQHGQIHSWENGEKAMVIAEYGDWEFYASNDGFDQKTGAGLLADAKNSRAFRGAGERRLRQQALNHIEALNDTLSSPAVCDGLWSMYDYPRGYHPTRAACGIMDNHRLPKYSYFFYRSQRGPEQKSVAWSGGPVVYVASRWVPDSVLDILVFSNCEVVTLSLNGKACQQIPASEALDVASLPYPPRVFRLPRFEPGVLQATGYIGGEALARHSVATPGEAKAMELVIEDEDVPGSSEEMDTLFAHARLVDAERRLCKLSNYTARFGVEGEAELVGPEYVQAESGVASVVIRRAPGCQAFTVYVEVDGFGRFEREYLIEDDSKRAVQANV